MYDIFLIYLSYPIPLRALIFISLLFLIWLFWAKFLLKMLSIIPFLFNKSILIVYIILDYIISLLHKCFGGWFGYIDKTFSSATEKIHKFFEVIFISLRFPKKVFYKELCLLYIAIFAYLVAPLIWPNLQGVFFSFWHEFYIVNETKILHLIDSTAFLEGNL